MQNIHNIFYIKIDLGICIYIGRFSRLSKIVRVNIVHKSST